VNENVVHEGLEKLTDAACTGAGATSATAASAAGAARKRRRRFVMAGLPIIAR
jgi:hypothetical protein